METTPQNTQPQGNEPQEPNPVAPQLSLPDEPQGQDKLVLKPSNFLMKEDFNTIADKGAISDLLSHLGQVFGNTDLISAAKIELACIQEELLKKPQEVESEVDYDGVLDAAKEVLESLEWEEDVTISYPTNMDVDWDGNDISVSYVEGSVSLSMSRSDAEEVAKDIVRRLKGEY